MKSACLKHYSKKEVQEAIVLGAKKREVGVMYLDRKFGKRPDTLTFSGDVLEFVKNGVTSFHVSEERWNNPLQLNTGMKRNELDSLRSGWDLVIDVDGKIFEFSAEATDLIIKALKYHGINAITCKFSGNKGFHIGVPYESFPEIVKGKEIAKWFPEGARAVAEYLKEMIKGHLAKRLTEQFSISEIQQKTGLQFKDIVKNNQFDPYSVLELDTVLISSRHLYRSQYSINEKSGLVSIPVDINKILQFKKESAKIQNLQVSKNLFLDPTNCVKNEARTLLVQAMDFAGAKESQTKERQSDKKTGKVREYDDKEITTAAPINAFPPCVIRILQGMTDGKKRAVFVMNNFLTSTGWNYEAIQELLSEWNKKNDPPLRENHIESHIRYHKAQKKKILPPNCSNNAYYKDLGLCNPDGLCAKIKNPVNYTLIKIKIAEKTKKQDETKIIKKKKKKENASRENIDENNIQ